MKITSALLLMVLSTAVSAQGFRIVTYNIRQGKGQKEMITPEIKVDLPFGIHIHVPATPLPIARSHHQLDKIADAMRSLNADVVTFQEVNDRSIQSRGRDQAAYIADKLHMNHVWALAQADGIIAKRQGNAVLSRHPIAEHYTVELNPAQGTSERRVALFCRVMIPGYANGVWICSTHTEAGSAAMRELAAPKFVEEIKKLKGPVVLSGDFNSGPDAKAMKDIFAGAEAAGRTLTDAFAKVGNGPGGTSSAPEGRVRIDYVLSTPELEPVNCYSPRDINVSDHFCMVANLRPAAAPAAPAETTTASLTAPTGAASQMLGVSMMGASAH